jgi:ABC-type nickel/cobalt efflux system permease component RcnA
MSENQNYQQHVIEPVPNGTAALVLGIVSIATCWLYGIIAVVCGIIGIVLANKATAAYNANPTAYTKASFNNAKAGKICAIIGLCLGALYLILLAFGLSFIAANGGFDRYR